MTTPSSMGNKLRIPAWIAFLLTFIFLLLFYHQNVLHPNDHLFVESGDGIKNYYTYLFHSKHDTEFSVFNGMNYPYANHIVYADAHPLLSWLVKIFGASDVGIGFLNLIMLLSMPLCAYFLCLIMLRFGVSTKWAVAASVGIAVLNPQQFRLLGHYSLSYSFLIPMIWYWTIRYWESGKFRFQWLLILTVLWSYFTHPYLGLMASAFLLLSGILFLLIAWRRKNIRFRVGNSFLLPSILPLVCFQLFVGLTDQHTDRLSNPGGMLEYYSGWRSILFPALTTGAAEFQYLLNVQLLSWEGFSYVGMTTILFALIILYRFIRKKPVQTFSDNSGVFLTTAFITAFFLLIFSFGFPLRWEFFDPILPYLGPLKQFRTLGRFAWVFYYVATISSVVIFYRMYQMAEKRSWMIYVFWLGMGMFLFESFAYHEHIADSIAKPANLFQKEHLPDEISPTIAYLNASDWDALMVLPVHHGSSGRHDINGTEEAMRDAFLLSYHTGLPLLNANTSRLSLSESKKFVELFSPSFVEKEILEDMEGDQKIAIFYRGGGIEWRQRRLLESAELRFEAEDQQVFELDLEGLRNSDRSAIISSREATDTVVNGWDLQNREQLWMYYDDFEDHSSEVSRLGSGALEGSRMGYSHLVKMEMDSLLAGETMVVSFWLHMTGEDCSNLVAIAEYHEDDQYHWLKTTSTMSSHLIVDDWALVELEFTIPEHAHGFNIVLSGQPNNKHRYVVDELLIRQKNVDVFKEVDVQGRKFLVYNNYWLAQEAP